MPELDFNIIVKKNYKNLASINTLRFEENKINFLFGESGIGKTILSKAIFGLLEEGEFEVSVKDKNGADHLSSDYYRQIRRNGFFVFQEPSSHLNPLLTIDYQLNEGSLANSGNQKEIMSALWDTNDYGSIKKLVDIYPRPYRPSGGEKQRILLSMAFKRIDSYLSSGLNENVLFIFDEPTGSLDNYFRDLFLNYLIGRFSRKNFTALIITHDYSMIGALYRSHPNMKESFHFTELARENKGLVQKEFSTEEYFTWLRGSYEKRDFENPADNTVVLSVTGGVGIFGGRLRFYEDSSFMNEIPLEVRKGTITYLKAPSGAGKTTAVKIISGLLHPDDFSMKLDRQTITPAAKHAIWKNEIWGKKITMVFQHADEALNQNSSVKDVFTSLSKYRNSGRNEITEILSELFDGKTAAAIINKKVKQLSGGQKQRINLLRGLALNTKVLILDEPINGLDFRATRKVIELIAALKNEGNGILLISHNEEIFDSIVPDKNVVYLKFEKGKT